MKAYKLPKMSEAERQARAAAISDAMKVAAETPFRTMSLAHEAMVLARPVVERGNKSSVSDAAVGAMNLQSAFHGARLNVLINLPSIEDKEFVAEKREAIDRMSAEVDKLAAEYLDVVKQRME
jgi:formiminotetrahydrofolate cyclodeaminase